MDSRHAPPPEPRAERRDDAPHLLDATMFWPASGVGGVRRVLAEKAAGLVARGWRHTLLAPGARGPGEIDAGGTPIPGTGYRWVWDTRHAARQIEKVRPDIVEAADPYALGRAVLDATARLGIPAAAFCHSDLPALAARLAGGAGPLARWAHDRARRRLVELYAGYDFVLAPSRAMTERLHDWGIAHAAQQPLGVDCRVFSPQARDPAWRQRLRDRLGLRAGTHLVVYAGRFAPEKNLHVLAEAVRLLGPGHALLVAGNGPTPPSGRHVRLLPPEASAQRVARLIASCDVFAHAGDQETFGLAALEAMACGTPVVARAAAGLGELVEGVGLTVASARPADWAEAIAAAIAEPNAPRVLDAMARAFEHDWPRVVAEMAQRYRYAMRNAAAAAAADDPTPTAPMVVR